jgi:hypothetical protein
MQRRENLAVLQKHVRGLHPADLAAILESLPPEDRLIVFRQLPRRDAGLTLVEVSTDLCRNPSPRTFWPPCPNGCRRAIDRGSPTHAGMRRIRWAG